MLRDALEAIIGGQSRPGLGDHLTNLPSLKERASEARPGRKLAEAPGQASFSRARRDLTRPVGPEGTCA